MKGKLWGIPFILSIFIYIIIAYFLQGNIRAVIKYNRDFKTYLYLLSLIPFLVSLYLAKKKNLSNKIIAYSIAEVPVLFAFVFFILTKFIYPLYIISFVAVLVILLITFTKGEEVES